LSSGFDDFKGVSVGLVDERAEIASVYNGAPTLDVGIQTDVLSNIKKSIGMNMIVRSMAPQVIVADEIGTKADAEAIEHILTLRSKRNFHSSRK
jgi:stage III sporulation protein AA